MLKGRHRALRPLTSEHVVALHQSQLLKNAARASIQDQDRTFNEFENIWRSEILPHFAEEEIVLPSFVDDPELVQQLIDEHREIASLVRKLSNSDAIECSVIFRLGELLEKHILWEENTLIPSLDKLDEGSMNTLIDQVHLIEMERHRLYARHKASGKDLDPTA